MAVHMVNCIECKQPFDIGGGYILMHKCPACLKRLPKPPAYIERGGLLIPNPEAENASTS